MNIDYILILMGWIITIILLFKFIPRNKLCEAQVAFLFKLSITWVSGLVVSQLGLIVYPVRFFPNANKTSFSFEYFIYPSICALFITNYPEKKSRFQKFMYYFYFCTYITIAEVFVERYTNILKYVHWTWYETWITLFITFFISRTYNLWFFKLLKKEGHT
ncbi:hypothetical protein BJV85_003865 [Clostridium acetobutylicum]|uniref:Uncharacterized protein n=1 Tax=Clostridium acetobutylicum (strain ATCC 824 / DSM 792 / JCM 1419 / IAM 19013 / LMG 5710 / NBRC 13948 / NRRL B-527 / VKM B-1787 / 2291 / W) TaxID=272562 RepID=Q97TS4_CLOAB|nr:MULTISPECIES: CBO0543 family protein [Clostridium]AAK76769.1 Hypothetical protein CA_P0023 [Clostridium acetobutylicum ATCC 824]ADZ22805.1 Conserved hypothetical protein [Clostridium acetobutylicum EA 2018]AEI34765.1 hypothetical protein SMB_P022 [Clostridium acetobutylicum DSM 1731]AWV82314.1 hypothetical protein DK921_19670 [Clostridium acetobutylicum]MBC2396022.1 hypothetical protein [Clostridium acetobutylicum]